MPSEPADFVPEDVPGAQPAQSGPMASQPGSPSSGRASWRSSSEAAPLILILVGIWMVASVAPFNYEAQLNPAISGMVLIGLAAVALVAIRVRWLRLLIGALGLWLMASPFVFEEARPATVNLIALGGVVLVLALVSLAVDQEGARESRG